MKHVCATSGDKMTYSSGYKKDDPSEKYFTIEQDGNTVYLTKERVLFIVEKGQAMINRWKVGKKFHKATGMRYKDNNG